MKNFGAILMVLAAGASFGAALPASNTEHGLVARGQPYYAIHVREPKRGKKGQNDGQNANNGTLIADPANNGTANGNDNNDNNNDNDKGKGKKGKDQGDDQGDAADAGNAGGINSILETLLGLLNGAAGGKGADNAAGAGAQAQNNPLAILEGLLNGA
ncbi:hypothetical protein F4859DRAFT_404452 [Xylaria cf. heliscus]|nr:hypothetical protein F4859DRAFT_404452 [Xylaria cf. heliscus]